jgi:hypothetical protein
MLIQEAGAAVQVMLPAEVFLEAAPAKQAVQVVLPAEVASATPQANVIAAAVQVKSATLQAAAAAKEERAAEVDGVEEHVLLASTLSSLAHYQAHRASTVRQARIWTQSATMRCPIALHVLRASTQSSMVHHPTHRASTVLQARIWRQSATMRCPIAWNVMQASTLSSMAHRLSQRASTVLLASTLSSMTHHLSQCVSTVRQARISRQKATMSCPIARHVLRASTQPCMAHHPTHRA